MVPKDEDGDAVNRRAIVASAGALVVAASIFACSLRDTAYLQAGGGTLPNEAGADSPTPGIDSSSAGTCKPVTVATNLIAPTLLTQDGQNLYWLSGEGFILAIKKDGSETAPRKLATAGQGVGAVGTADSAPLFYSKDTQIFVVDKSAAVADSAGTPIGVANPTARALAVDPEFVFAMAEDDSSNLTPELLRFGHDGGARTVMRAADESLFMTAMTIQGNEVFWDEGEGIFRSLPKTAAVDAGPTLYEATGGTAETALNPAAFAVDENAFYYSDGQSVRSHARIPLSSATTVLSYASAESVSAIAIDDRFVYAIDTAAGGTLRRNTKNGKGTPELLLDALAKPNAVVVDAASVYVVLEGPPGTIVKCAK